jgi:hypothetical protein
MVGHSSYEPREEARLFIGVLVGPEQKGSRRYQQFRMFVDNSISGSMMIAVMEVVVAVALRRRGRNMDVQ